jgi:hypothetical protein
MESSTTNFTETKDDARGGSTGTVNNARLRRQKRLVGNGRSVNRRSPQTISEHQSMDWHDKLALSAAATADTAIMSIDTPETPTDRVRVRKLPSNPAYEKTHTTFESDPFSDIVMMTRTFPPPDTSSDQIPMRPKMKNSRIAAPDSLPTPDQLPRGHQFEPRSGERQPRGGECHENSIPIIPNARLLTPSFDEPRRFPKPKSRVHASRPKAELRRHSTAPTPTTPIKETNVLDHVLMDRALLIRQNLISFEMQELAEEAEKAAESGLEKFVGSASKFGVEETPPYRPQFVEDGELLSSREGDEFRTPLRSRKFFVENLTNRIDYTPSYFARKKIPVTSLRNFSEVIPKFSEMHNNIRIHLGSEGVDTIMLPELHTRRSLMLNETDDTDKECGDDVISHSPSVAGSISSFSSYAVASLASLRDVIDYIQRPISSLPNISRDNVAVTNDAQQSGSLKKSCHLVDGKKGTTTSPQILSSQVNSDSDDSSVEYYGRKSPIEASNHCVTSYVSERREWITSPSQSSRSNISAGNTKQTLLQRRIKNGTAPSVTFENEKETYQALLDRMQHSPGNRASTASFDVDQNSCAPSLATLDIFPSSSATRANAASPMADFLTKLQHQFSLTSDDGLNSPSIEEENKHFVTNYFYTTQDSSDADLNSGFSTLNLEINPEQRKDSNFFRGCGSNNLLTACDYATKYADLITDWFHVGRDSKVEKFVSIINPHSPVDQSPNPKWLNSWQISEPEDKICRRKIFVPPKLSVRHTVENHESGTFCSNKDSANMRYECDDSVIACPEIALTPPPPK